MNRERHFGLLVCHCYLFDLYFHSPDFSSLLTSSASMIGNSLKYENDIIEEENFFLTVSICCI